MAAVGELAEIAGWIAYDADQPPADSHKAAMLPRWT
jgi:hypothetical protein